MDGVEWQTANRYTAAWDCRPQQSTWPSRSPTPAANKQHRPRLGLVIKALTHLQQHGVVKRLSQLLACLQGPLLTALLLLTLLHLLTLTLLSLWLDL